MKKVSLFILWLIIVILITLAIGFEYGKRYQLDQDKYLYNLCKIYIGN